MMRLCAPVFLVVAVLGLVQAPSAQAQVTAAAAPAPEPCLTNDPVPVPGVATFERIRDAVPKRNFDADTSDPGKKNPNALVFGLDGGFDVQSLSFTNFAVSQLAYYDRVATDTMAFRVVAPAGCYISKLVYKQKGVASTLRGAVQKGTASWVVAGFPNKIDNFVDPNINGTANVDDMKRTSLPVSVTVSLFAGAGGSLEITDARVVVTLAKLPAVQ